MINHISHRPYFIDFREKKIPHRIGPLDSMGIPLVDYRDYRGAVYNPITVIQYGLAHHQLWLDTQAEHAFAVFWNCVDWLVDHQEVDLKRQIGTWVYHFDLPDLGTQAPWISGMAQGQALSILARAWQLEQRDTLSLAARRALNSFYHSVADGGITTEIEPGYVFYQEVAPRPIIHILNGFLYALVGLYEYSVVWSSEDAHRALHRGLNTIQHVIGRFDSGYWSRYSMYTPNHLADRYYHEVHIQQLAYLGKVCELPELIEWSEKWASYLVQPTYRLRHAITLWSQKVGRRLGLEGNVG
jgi:heparosan-N-sulfate-glucuronate 5-epimerase